MYKRKLVQTHLSRGPTKVPINASSKFPILNPQTNKEGFFFVPNQLEEDSFGKWVERWDPIEDSDHPFKDPIDRSAYTDVPPPPRSLTAKYDEIRKWVKEIWELFPVTRFTKLDKQTFLPEIKNLMLYAGASPQYVEKIFGSATKKPTLGINFEFAEEILNNLLRDPLFYWYNYRGPGCLVVGEYCESDSD